MYLRFMCYKFKLIDVIAIPTCFILIIWLGQSCYIFTAQLKFNVHIYKSSKDIYNLVKLSPHSVV